MKYTTKYYITIHKPLAPCSVPATRVQSKLTHPPVYAQAAPLASGSEITLSSWASVLFCALTNLTWSLVPFMPPPWHDCRLPALEFNETRLLKAHWDIAIQTATHSLSCPSPFFHIAAGCCGALFKIWGGTSNYNLFALAPEFNTQLFTASVCLVCYKSYKKPNKFNERKKESLRQWFLHLRIQFCSAETTSLESTNINMRFFMSASPAWLNNPNYFD